MTKKFVDITQGLSKHRTRVTLVTAWQNVFLECLDTNLTPVRFHRRIK